MPTHSFFSGGRRALMSPVLFGIIVMFSAAGCAPGGAASSPRVAAPPELRHELLVSPAWVAGQSAEPVVILHVASDRAEYDREHLPGARFLSLGSIITERDGNISELPAVSHLDSVFESVGVGDNVRVVVYGAPLAAARTFFTLDYLGHNRTSLLNGGMAGWKAAGRPVSTETPAPTRGVFTPKPTADRVVDAAWIRGRLDDTSVALVDARPEAQFTGVEPGAGIQRPGHIPGAGSVFWERMVHSTGHPVLHEPEALHAMLHAAGVKSGDTVVAYCRSGMQASFAYFVARYLGYDAKMYDGSFLDWSRRTELPVVR